MKKNIGLTIDYEVYMDFKKIVRNASAEVNEFMKSRLNLKNINIEILNKEILIKEKEIKEKMKIELDDELRMINENINNLETKEKEFELEKLRKQKEEEEMMNICVICNRPLSEEVSISYSDKLNLKIHKSCHMSMTIEQRKEINEKYGL